MKRFKKLIRKISSIAEGGDTHNPIRNETEYKQISLDMTRGEMFTILSFLSDLERSCSRVRYLEIGVFGGGNINFLKKNTTKTVFTGIDLFEDFQRSPFNTHGSGTYTLESVQKSLGNEVRLIKGRSELILPKMTEYFDFIFIDGNHTYQATKEDFSNSTRLLAPKGYIGFHNCSSSGEPDIEYNRIDGGPWKVTQEIKRMPEWFLETDTERVKVFSRRSTI